MYFRMGNRKLYLGMQHNACEKKKIEGNKTMIFPYFYQKMILQIKKKSKMVIIRSNSIRLKKNNFPFTKIVLYLSLKKFHKS